MEIDRKLLEVDIEYLREFGKSALEERVLTRYGQGIGKGMESIEIESRIDNWINIAGRVVGNGWLHDDEAGAICMAAKANDTKEFARLLEVLLARPLIEPEFEYIDNIEGSTNVKSDDVGKGFLSGLKKWIKLPKAKPMSTRKPDVPSDDLAKMKNEIAVSAGLVVRGNGNSLATAAVVEAFDTRSGIFTEYKFIGRNEGDLGTDWAVKGQESFEVSGRVFDEITILNFNNGETRSYFFDVTSFFGR